MGVTYDIGGLYAPPAKILGPLKIGIEADGRVLMLDQGVERTVHGAGYIPSEYKLDGRKVIRKTFHPPGALAIVQDLEIDGKAEIVIRGKGNLVPYGLLGMIPSSVKVFHDKRVNGLVFWSRDLGYYGVIGCSGRLEKYVLDGHEDVAEITLPTPSFELSYSVDGKARIVVAGSPTASRRPSPKPSRV